MFRRRIQLWIIKNSSCKQETYLESSVTSSMKPESHLGQTKSLERKEKNKKNSLPGPNDVDA